MPHDSLPRHRGGILAFLFLAGASAAPVWAASPTITQEPQSQTVLVGSNVSFTVTASSSLPLFYQWQKDGTNLADGGSVNGATNSALTISGVQPGNSGGYWVVVNDSGGAVTSSVATLTVGTVRYVNVNSPNPVPPYTNWAGAAVTIQQAVDVALPGDEIVVTNGTYATGGRAVHGAMTNRVAVDRPVVLQSVNGPQFTVIQGRKVPVTGTGDGAIRCVYLTNGAVLSGFTLSNGATRQAGDWLLEQSGAGVLCESVSAVVSNCTLSGNVAAIEGGGAFSGTLNTCTLSGNSCSGPCGGEGGGAASSTLNNCTLSGNSATSGGGTLYGTLNNCKVIGNSARDPAGSRLGEGGGTYSAVLTNCTVMNNYARVTGGGASWGTLVGCLVAGNSALQGGGAAADLVVNCTVVGNSAPSDGGVGGGLGGGVLGGTVVNSIIVQNQSTFGDNNWGDAALSYCCTTPDPGGVGNITDDPAFIDYAGGNYRLQTNSPCINAGSNGCLTVTVDLDGAPRVVDGIVDMGAYEHQRAPWILVSPASQSAVVTSNVTFTVSVLGDEPLTYQWQKDGVNLVDDGRITGATTPTLVISPVLVQDAGSYWVIITNASGIVTSAVATLTTLGPPSISGQPVSQSAPAGTNVSFSVTASGLATLFYQWRFNQFALVGATNSALTLMNVQSPSAGSYDVVITNIYGAVTSAAATLAVSPAAPTITTQAVSRVASVGQNVPFTVAARGSEPMSCQWLFNGTNLPGANAFTLTLTNVNSSFNGTYQAAITNAAGFAVSSNVTLSVVPVLAWGITNYGATAIPAAATNVVAIAAGKLNSPCLALRADGALVGWGYNAKDAPIPASATNVVAMAIGGSSADQGLTSSAYSLALRADGTVVGWGINNYGQINVPASATNVVAIAAGGYHSLALLADGTVLAWGLGSFGQTNVPASATNVVAIAAGANHCLALRADGTVVGWGLNRSGQATALSNAANVVAIAAGGDQSMALRADGTVVGWIVTNTGPQSLFYGPPPADATNMIAIAAGASHSLGLRADGTIASWGYTNYGLTTPPTYATNVVAIAAGANDSLALVQDPFVPPIPPRIARPPQTRAVDTGQSIVLNALVIGGLPLRYQWYLDGVPLAGETNRWLVLTGMHPRDAGDYQLVAMNNFGSATSTMASVSVAIPPPVLQSFTWGSNGFSFAFQSVNGILYVTEYASALGAGAWTELERRIGSGGTELVTDSLSDAAARLYRVRALFAPSPKLSSVSWSGGAVNFNFSTVAGAVYVVQYKDRLHDPAWLELSRQTGAGATIVVNDPRPPGSSRFYRVKVE